MLGLCSCVRDIFCFQGMGSGYGFGVRSRKVKSRDCALAIDLVRLRAIS